MGAHSGPAQWWTTGTDDGRAHIAKRGKVQSGIILNIDAGVKESYPGTGSTLYDLSPSGSNFTLTGLDFNTSKGGYFTFGDNQGDRALKTSQTILGGSNVLTLSMWLRPTSTQSTQAYFSYAASNTYNNELLIIKEASNIGVYYYNTQYSVTSYNLPLNNWLNMAISFSTSSFIFYVNGNAIRTVSKTTSSLKTGGAIAIGQEQDTVGGTFDNTQDYVGDFAVCTIYNTALSQTDIRKNFNAYRKRFGI